MTAIGSALIWVGAALGPLPAPTDPSLTDPSLGDLPKKMRVLIDEAIKRGEGAEVIRSLDRIHQDTERIIQEADRMSRPLPKKSPMKP